jgi:hypothetical protein
MFPPRQKCGAFAAIATGALSGIVPGALLGAGVGAGLGAFVAGVEGEFFLCYVGTSALIFAGFGSVGGLVTGAALWSHVQRCSGRMLRFQEAAWLLSGGGDVAALKGMLRGLLIGTLFGVALGFIGVASVLSGAVGKRYGGNVAGALGVGIGACASSALLLAVFAALAGRFDRRLSPSRTGGSGDSQAPGLLTRARRGALAGAIFGLPVAGTFVLPIVVSEGPLQALELGITIAAGMAWALVLTGFVIGACGNVLMALELLSKAPTLAAQPNWPRGLDEWRR